ncbi:RNA polymerase sigma factor [Duganella rhizosphaerae]|uniref:sigma-70 family RNA polymerase sigma factor n=1 Tax=Duganella rhizosphaerae TaxID=2885763 RepID=UPI0030E80F31
MLSYRDGDLAAFAELYRRHSQGLYLFLAWRSPRREWVNDIMQDSWANLHQARARYEPGASFRTYLFQIARNRLIDLIRMNERVLLASDGEDDWFDHLADAAQDSPAPDGQLERKQQTSRLHAMIRLLPVDQREALVLQQFNGMSLEEIAELVAAPVETVKSRLRYAMRKLRQELAPAAEEARA